MKQHLNNDYTSDLRINYMKEYVFNSSKTVWEKLGVNIFSVIKCKVSLKLPQHSLTSIGVS